MCRWNSFFLLVYKKNCLFGCCFFSPFLFFAVAICCFVFLWSRLLAEGRHDNLRNRRVVQRPHRPRRGRDARDGLREARDRRPRDRVLKLARQHARAPLVRQRHLHHHALLQLVRHRPGRLVVVHAQVRRRRRARDAGDVPDVVGVVAAVVVQADALAARHPEVDARRPLHEDSPRRRLAHLDGRAHAGHRVVGQRPRQLELHAAREDVAGGAAGGEAEGREGFGEERVLAADARVADEVFGDQDLLAVAQAQQVYLDAHGARRLHADVFDGALEVGFDEVHAALRILHVQAHRGHWCGLCVCRGGMGWEDVGR
eukprot:Rhum_TRINITY_DN13987_c0_g1::Rhum_TRINITY_DN13987_c0_g1_i1::g.66009::m.66009